MVTIYDRSFYEHQAARSLQSARTVLGKLFPLIQPKRVVDIGCGVGAWLKAALEFGANEVCGVDGTYVDQSMLMIQPTQFRATDIETVPLTTALADKLTTPFDLAISLETAEHLSYARAKRFVAELTALSDLILFSAAVPFQGGTNHINEQWPEFWAILFRAHGYECWDWLRRDLWIDRDVDWWYAQNTLVFAKPLSTAAAHLPIMAKVQGKRLGLVHPENFLSNILGNPRVHRAEALGEELDDFYAVIEAQLQQAKTLPHLASISRAEAADPDAKNVFPWTRSELFAPEQLLQAERDKYLALETLARDEIRRRELAERNALDISLKTRKRDDLNNRLKLQIDDMANQIQSLKAAYDSTSYSLTTTRAQLDILYGSTLWRALSPVRYLAGKLPFTLRRRLRKTIQLAWWSVTLTLPAKLKAHQNAAVPADTASTATTFADFQPACLSMAEERLLRFAPFDSGYYFDVHPDVSKSHLSAAAHAVRFGGGEGRKLFRDEAVARAVGNATNLPVEPATKATAPGQITQEVPIGIYCNRHGNSFMKEIADDLASDLREIGANVQILDETSSVDMRPPICLFVAPHEFFNLGQGAQWLREDIITHSFMLNTEQVQTTWFARALPFLLMARGVLDICSQSAQLLTAAGVYAVHMPHSMVHRPDALQVDDREHPLFKVLPAAAKDTADPERAWNDRPLDINFFGATSPYRDTFFARHAARFAEYEAFLYCRRSRTPLSAKGVDGGMTRLAAHVAAHSRLSLNIHRDEFSYFEWHRVVKLGMYQGSIVVSEPCLPHPTFVAGTHYFEENARYIPDLVDWLLKTEDGKDAARVMLDNTDALFQNMPPPRDMLAPIAEMLWQGYE